jgi:hypothetical protein
MADTPKKKMITSLTPEQEARMPEFRDKWTRIGLCTDPADRPAAEAGVNQAYRSAGLEPPQKIVWCDSPFSQAVTRAAVIAYVKTEEIVTEAAKAGDAPPSLPDDVRDEVLRRLARTAWAAVFEKVYASINKHMKPTVVESVRVSVADSVGPDVGECSAEASASADLIMAALADGRPGMTLMYQVMFFSGVQAKLDAEADAMRAMVGQFASNSVWDSAYGQHEAHWLAFCDYFREVCGLVEETDNIQGLCQIARNAGWWIPYVNICWISERHTTVHMNDRGVLHSVDGPALAYPDGWSIYSVNGVVVPRVVVEDPASQSVEDIRRESNAEVKRIRIERFGWTRYLEAVGAKVVDTRRNDVEATDEALMVSPDGETVLVCACPSTARVYSQEVPPETATCEAAQEWLSGGLSGRTITAS